MVADIELIGVPFDGYGRAGHQARASGALRDAGLRDAFDHHHVIDDDDLALPDPDPARGASTSLINEPALLAMTVLSIVRWARWWVRAGPVLRRRRLLDAAGHRDGCAITSATSGWCSSTATGHYAS